MPASAIDQLAAFAVAPDAPAWLAPLTAAIRELREGGRDEPVLTTEQAVRVANLTSDDAFYRWAKTWRVTPSGHGRWSRRAIQLGLQREADSVLKPKRTKPKSPSCEPIAS